MESCSVVRRFKGTYKGHNYDDAIQFKTDRDIRLVGIGVYIGEGELIFSTRLLKILGDNEDSAEEVASSNEVNIDYPSSTISRISFTNPCLIPANEWHLITVMRSYISHLTYHDVKSYLGSDGKDRVEADGVVFDFRRSEFSLEDWIVGRLEHGQNPEIYFELQIELGDIKLKYQQQQAECKLEALQTVKTTLKFNDLEKLDKLLVTIQLENGNNIYYDNVKPFELFAMIDGKRENADLKLLEGEYDCSFKGVMGNYAYFSSARRKIVRFFKVSIADSKIQLEMINELKTTDLIPFENQPLYFIEESREWIVFHYHENYTKMEGEKFDISELRSIRKFDCHYHRGILYFFRENTPPKLERLNEKVVVVEAPVFDGQLSYYTPPHSDYIYVANTDQNILITLNTTNLHVAQHSYEPPIDSTYHSIVGVHNGILTMVFEGTVGRCLMTTKLSYIDLSP